MKRYLTDDRARLALASLIIQASNFLVLVLAKATLPHEDFAFLLTQLAIAGIVGSVASMRLETLLFQAHKSMTHAAILAPIASIAGVIALSFAVFGLIYKIWPAVPEVSPLSIPMMAGLGLGTVLNFAFVQIKRLNLLLAARTAQAAALGCMIVVLSLGWWTPTGHNVLLVSGICYAAPAILWTAHFLFSLPADKRDDATLIPDMATMRRAVSLTTSTGVNSLYVNMALLVAASTQSPSFVADFGLIARAFTAPITLISQVIGRLFLADAMNWSIAASRTPLALKRLMNLAMAQSLGLYLAVTPLLLGGIYLYRVPLNFSHFDMAPYLFLASLGQCAVNPISQVRISLSDERTFLAADALRVLGLALGLLWVARFIPFEIAFGATSLALYTGYIAFIYHRVSGYASR